MSALEDSQIEQYQSRATANEKAETETELYRTRTVVTESGSKVAETAV